MPQTEEMERLFVHPFTPKPKDGRPMTQHLRTSLHTNVWRSMILVVWAQRVVSRHAFPTQKWRFTAHSQTQKLVIRSKRRVTGCLIVRRRACSPRWHTRRVPRTVLSERLVLIRSPVKKNTLCSTTRAPKTVDNRANTASTAYCGYHTKSLNTDDTQSSNSTVTNVEFSAPRVVTSTLRATLS